MMIVSCEIEEQHKVSIQTGSGLNRLLKNSDQNIKKIQKIETETEMAARLYEILKLGKSFEECMRVVRESVDETSAISHLMEKY